MFGVGVFKAIRTVNLANAQQETVTEWRAPQLGCFTLQVDMEMGGKPFTRMTTVLLQVGEPSPIMFDTAAGHTEMKASDLRNSMYSSMGVTETVCPICFSDLDKVDTLYFQRQSPLN